MLPKGKNASVRTISREEWRMIYEGEVFEVRSQVRSKTNKEEE